MTSDDNDIQTAQLGDLEVWYIPQVPMKAFKYPVPSIAVGKTVLDALEMFSLFEYENRIKPDYADAGGIIRYEEDGDGGFDWFDVEDEEAEDG